MRRSPRTEDVFTPKLARKYSYVRREGIWERALASLRLQGMLLVHGPYRVGKTNLVVFASKILKRPLVRVHCSSEWSTFTEVKRAIAFSFPRPRLERSAGPVGRLITNLFGYLTGFGVIAPPPPSPGNSDEECAHNVDAFLHRMLSVRRRRPLVICIDDVHRLKAELVGPLIEYSKDTSESATYTFLASGSEQVVRELRGVIHKVPDAMGRIADLEIPIWSKPELHSVLEMGEAALNVQFEDALKKKVVELASGDIARLHGLAFNCCEIAGIRSRLKKEKPVRGDVYREAVREYYSRVDQRLAGRLDEMLGKLVKYVRHLANRLAVQEENDVELVLSGLVTGEGAIVGKDPTDSFITFANDEAREVWSRLRVRDTTNGGWNRVYNAMIGAI